MRSRILVRLGGRLGNQMFQFAAGKALANRLDAELTVEGFDRETSSKSYVQVFGAFDIPLSYTRIRKTRLDKLRIKLSKRGVTIPGRGPKLFVEKGFRYDPGFESLQGSIHLIGGWQSHRYFECIGDEIRATFSGPATLSTNARDALTQISSTTLPVAVHVRRGDYASNPRILSRHGLCGRDYYLRAANHLQANGLHDCHFFVFSDEPHRAREVLGNLTNTTFVQNTSQEEDIFLMSACRHNIIANSTFSWWSAWLNPREDKVVIAPKAWFGPKLMQINDTRDLFPDEWALI